MQDKHNSQKAVIAYNGATLSADAVTNGNSIDATGFNSIEFIDMTGARSAGNVTPSFQGSDDNSVWNNIAAADINGTPTALATANAIARYGIKVDYKYYRMVKTTASSANLYTSAIALLGNPRHAPVA